MRGDGRGGHGRAINESDQYYVALSCQDITTLNFLSTFLLVSLSIVRCYRRSATGLESVPTDDTRASATSPG